MHEGEVGMWVSKKRMTVDVVGGGDGKSQCSVGGLEVLFLLKRWPEGP